MNPETGRVYRADEIEAAEERGEPLVLPPNRQQRRQMARLHARQQRQEQRRQARGEKRR